MPQPISHKVWFITGASKGFGYVWTEAALARGDRVAAAARNIGSLDTLKAKYGDRLLPLALDVGDKGAVDAAVKQGHQRFGRIDVAINNAGYGLFGAIEEVSEQEARAQIETNLFGALWVTQAVLPIMRGAAFWAHYPDLLRRRYFCGADCRALSRLKMGPRGLQPGAGSRGERSRYKSHYRRARRFRDRMGHGICASRSATAGLRRRARRARQNPHRIRARR